MLKHMLLIGAAAMSFPAIAQETQPAGDDPATAPAGETTPADPTQTSPADPTTPPSADPANPAEPAAPGDPGVPADPATPAEPATPADPANPQTGEVAPGGAAATPGQVAQIVNQEFPTYDSDANGDLSETEFGTWMKKLRTATDPTVDPESEQVKSWIAQAFAAADADGSGRVSKEELTSFLSRGA